MITHTGEINILRCQINQIQWKLQCAIFVLKDFKAAQTHYNSANVLAIRFLKRYC